eukprot:843222-Rhodomonas_salina.1
MPGTHIAHSAYSSAIAYARATPCPVLTPRMGRAGRRQRASEAAARGGLRPFPPAAVPFMEAADACAAIDACNMPALLPLMAALHPFVVPAVLKALLCRHLWRHLY